MILYYGNYFFPVGQVEVLPSMKTQRDESGRPFQYDWTITVRGLMLASAATPESSSSLVLSNADNAMRTALSFTGRDLILYDDYNRPTSINFVNNNLVLSPMTCIEFSLPDGGAGELVTKRAFSATFVVSYAANRTGTYLSYHEQITMQGNGGPLIRWQNSINGPPVPIEVYPETPITMIVSGSATGYERYPEIPKSLLPVQYLQNPDYAVTAREPRWMGNLFGQYREFPITWNFIYQGRVSDLQPSKYFPRVWPAGR